MSVQGKDDERPKLEKFDGSMPASYRRWRRKAELMLLALPNTFTKERWGAKVMEYLAGEIVLLNACGERRFPKPATGPPHSSLQYGAEIPNVHCSFP